MTVGKIRRISLLDSTFQERADHLGYKTANRSENWLQIHTWMANLRIDFI